MKLVKLQDLSNRPVSTTELLIKYIFDGNLPKKFIPEHEYKKDDIVYSIVDGEVHIYECIEAGTYSNFNTGWKSMDISSDVADTVNRFINAGTGEADKLLNSTERMFDYYVYNENSIDVIDHKYIKLNEKYKDYDTFIELFINGERLSVTNCDYVIDAEKSMITLVNYVIDTDDRFALYIAKGHNINSRLILRREFGCKNIKGNEITFDIDLFLTGTYNLYYKGLFIPSTEYGYTFSGVNNTITISINEPSNFIMLKSHFVLVSMESRSKHLSAYENYYRVSSNATANSSHEFRIDLRHEAFDIDNGENVRLFVNGKNVDGCHISINREILSITKIEDYLTDEPAEIYLKINKYFISDDSVDLYGNFKSNTESLSILDVDELSHFPIPFINYNQKMDYMVFKEDGSKISARKFYEDDGMINYYQHEEGLLLHDVMNFCRLDTGSSVSIYSKFVDINHDGPLTVDIVGDLPEYFNLLVFTQMGSYISKSNYNITNGVIKFDNSLQFTTGDEVEIVIIEFNGVMTDTLVDVRTVSVDSSGILRLPYYNIDPKNDNILIFRDNGMYVGNTRYSIDPNTFIVDFKSGLSVNPNDVFDVVVIRPLKDFISLSDLKNQTSKL